MPDRARTLAIAISISPFGELFKTFSRQLVSGSWGSRGGNAREAAIWTTALLLPPGVFLLIGLMPEYELAVLKTIAGRVPVGYVDDLLAWIVFLFTTYAMVASGLVAVLSWDALTFERGDAMVLGPLPLGRSVVAGAKLAALFWLFAAGSIPINVINASVFALVTSNHEPVGVLLSHFGAFLAATLGASASSFAAVVAARAIVSMVAGPRIAAVCAAPLQFVLVVALCSLVILCPFVLDVSFTSAAFTNALPSAWFVGIFEFLRDSPRFGDPVFPFLAGMQRAIAWLPLVGLGAIGLSLTQFQLQMSASLAPRASVGILESSPVTRLLARWLAGRDSAARAMAEFAIVTVARNRAQRGALAVTAAIAGAIVIAALVHRSDSLADIRRARIATLWIPLVVGYWTAVGARAALFKPTETTASWVFQIVPTAARTRLRGARAALSAIVLVRTLAGAFLIGPVVGWSLAFRHAVYVALLAALIARVFARSLGGIPFTRSGDGAESALKGRWALHAVGVFVFAYFPVWLERTLSPSTVTAGAAVVLALVTVVLTWLERRRPEAAEDIWQTEPDGPLDGSTTLDLAGAVRRPPG